MSFYRILEVTVPKSKSMNEYSESRSIQTIEQNAIVQWFGVTRYTIMPLNLVPRASRTSPSKDYTAYLGIRLKLRS